MNADRYDQMNLPTLRREVADRGLPFGMARTDTQLRQLLREDDVRRTRPASPVQVPSPVDLTPQAMASPPLMSPGRVLGALPSPPPMSPGRFPVMASPPPMSPGRVPAALPSPPRAGRVRPPTAVNTIPFDLNNITTPTAGLAREIPMVPVKPGTGVVRAAPTGTTQRIPIKPVIPVTLPATTAEPVPVEPTRRIPMIPVTRRVPTTGDMERDAAPRIPVVTPGARIPPVPVATPGAGTRIPPVPVATPGAGTRIPPIPVPTPGAGTRIPPVPVATPGAGTRIPPVPVATPGAGTRIPPIPVPTPGAGTRIPPVPVATGGAAVTPVTTGGAKLVRPVLPGTTPQLPPITVPVAPPTPEQIRASIQAKTATATFDLYNPVWKRATAYLTPKDTSDGYNFVKVFNTNHRMSYKGGVIYTMEYLMTIVTPEFLTQLCFALGFKRLNASIDTYYNLLWYLHVAENPFGLNLNDNEKEYISELEINDLLTLLGPTYRGPRDKASLLFALVSGKSASRPDLNDLPRYETVKFYPREAIWRIAQDMYNLIAMIEIDGNTEYIISPLPPYVYVASQPENPIERIVASVDETNVDRQIETYQIVLPPTNLTMLPKDKVKYFIKQLLNYDDVFRRSPAILPPPILTGKTKQQMKDDLVYYTMKELVEGYEPIGVWRDRNDLIDIIVTESRGGAVWSWRNRYCNNDDTMNMTEFPPTLHGQVNKDDDTNPTLSYGVPKNYRCYQLAELETAFSNENKFFNVPDYDQNNPIIDRTTGGNLVEIFPIQSIRQLNELLGRAPAKYNVATLRRIITEGLDANRMVVQETNRLRNQFTAKSEAEQYLIKVYLAWMFFYSMWMRFWKGPGNPWPTDWIEGGGAFAGRCGEPERDWHVKLQGKVRNFILGSMDPATYPGLVNWIDTLPLVNYDFKSESAMMATTPNINIKRIIDVTLEGKFCLAHGSDFVSRTSYYLIMKLLNLKDNAEFNAFINQFGPVVFNMELQTINWLLDNPNENNIDETILQARRTELEQPLAPFPEFIPRMLKRSGHTDPGIGYNIRFE
jgi:hypothetical protein